MSDTTPDADASTEPPTVLIVEDEKDLADLFAAWLADRYEIRTAHDGETALENVDESVDVVLLDRRMPGLAGDEVLKEIRNRNFDCRVVVVSAVDPDFDIIKMGFDDYLNKPVDKERLSDTVERMVALTSYDETLQEYQQLVRARSMLSSGKRQSELEASDEFAELEQRITELEPLVDDRLEEIAEEGGKDPFGDLDKEDEDTRRGSNISDGDIR